MKSVEALNGELYLSFNDDEFEFFRFLQKLKEPVEYRGNEAHPSYHEDYSAQQEFRNSMRHGEKKLYVTRSGKMTLHSSNSYRAHYEWVGRVTKLTIEI